jgi:L-alanine-DL-glutamate epimerase-like enolase superfamily enzyme
MKIARVETTPLFVPYARPFYWAQGVTEGAAVVLVQVHTDAGIVGYGESVGTPSPTAIQACLELAERICVGRDPFTHARLMSEVYQRLFQAQGTGSAPRFAGQVFCGLEMALWDVMGKAMERPVHELLGGAVRDEIGYFGFAQGEDAAAVAADAAQLAADGCEVIYVKAGRGDDVDLATVKAVRAAIGLNRRMRVDANEHWAPDHAKRMIAALALAGVEVVEQPTSSESLQELAQVRASSPVAIAADQAVFTPSDVYAACRIGAADLIVIGLHETGGLSRFRKAAHVAEAAGVNVCVHSVHETGITTCAANQVAATVPNLDDANQHMTRFLEYDIVKRPALTLRAGRLPVLDGPGLGFDLDWDAIERARADHAGVGR